VLGRFRTKADSQQFRNQCRAAIAAATLDKRLFDTWCKANDARRVSIKTTGTKVTSAPTRARLEQAEQQSYEKLLAALPQQDRIAATVMETGGDVKQLLVQSDVTIALATDIKDVLVGVPLQNGTPSERIAAANTSIAILVTAKRAARADAAAARALAKKEAKAAENKDAAVARALARKEATAAAKKDAATTRASARKEATAAAKAAVVLQAVQSVSRKPKRGRSAVDVD
jgi:hypothetical protein